MTDRAILSVRSHSHYAGLNPHSPYAVLSECSARADIQQVGALPKILMPFLKLFLSKHPAGRSRPPIYHLHTSRNVAQTFSRIAGRHLTLPAVSGLFEKQGEICHMGRLSEQWTGLAHRLHFRSFHDTLVCRDLRMCIGIVCLNTEPVEVFHHIDFHPQILGVTEVHRFIIGILAFVQQPVFDRSWIFL